MSKIIRFIDTTPDGTIELFQAPEQYVAGTLWVNEVNGVGNTVVRQPVDMGGEFFQITPAPLFGTRLFCSCEIEVVDPTLGDGLTPWEHGNINKLLEVTKSQQEALRSMESALTTRITRSAFNAWASIIEQQIKDLKATLLKE
jgi:hypothetical protein